MFRAEAEQCHHLALDLCNERGIPAGLAAAYAALGYIAELRHDDATAERDHGRVSTLPVRRPTAGRKPSHSRDWPVSHHSAKAPSHGQATRRRGYPARGYCGHDAGRCGRSAGNDRGPPHGRAERHRPGDCPPPRPCQAGRRYRRLALAYPKVVPLLVTRPLATPLAFHPKGILRPFENVLALLTAAGFCDRRSSLAAVGTHGATAAPEVPGPPCCSYVTSAVSWPSWPGPP